MVFTFQKRIYGYECDAYGHLNNASYLQLLEAARSEALLAMNLSIEALREKDIHIYLTRFEIDYLRGIPLEEIVTVKTWIAEGNRLRAVWIQEVYNAEQKLCCRANVFGAFVRQGKPARISPEDFEILRPYVLLEMA
jgi:YbgC/YbaW family acyl-CoA thioester hydrolase